MFVSVKENYESSSIIKVSNFFKIISHRVMFTLLVNYKECIYITYHCLDLRATYPGDITHYKHSMNFITKEMYDAININLLYISVLFPQQLFPYHLESCAFAYLNVTGKQSVAYQISTNSTYVCAP